MIIPFGGGFQVSAGVTSPVVRGGLEYDASQLGTVSSITVPAHADAVAGDTVVLAVVLKNADVTITPAGTGWTELSHEHAGSGGGETVLAVFVKSDITSGEASTGVVVNYGSALGIGFAMTITLDGGTYEQYDKTAFGAYSTIDCPALTGVIAQSTIVQMVIAAGPDKTLTPTPDFVFNPRTGYTNSKSGGAYWLEDVSAGTVAAKSVSLAYSLVSAFTIEIGAD